MLPGRKFDLMRNPKSRAATAPLSFLAAAALSAQQAPIRAEAAPTVMADGSIFDAAYYAAAVGISEAAMYQHYETFGKAEGRLPCDPRRRRRTFLRESPQKPSCRTLSIPMMRSHSGFSP